MGTNFIDHFFDETFVREIFERNSLRLFPPELTISNCKTNPIKLSKTGGKSVIEIVLQLCDELKQERMSKAMVGHLRPDGRNEKVYNLLRELWKQGFDGRDHLKIVEPIAYFSKWNLMLTSKAEGIELDKVLTPGSSLGRSYLKRVAQWLVKLHSTHVKSGRVCTIREEVEKLNGWGRHLTLLRPHLAKRIQSVISQAVEKERSIRPRHFALTHGDYHPKNIFVNGVDLTVMDFEHSCMSDPAKDLGYFLAYCDILRRIKSERPLDPRVLNSFLKEYSAEAPTDGLGRIPTYKACTYLKHLHYVYWDLRKTLDPTDFEYWLMRAEECTYA